MNQQTVPGGGSLSDSRCNPSAASSNSLLNKVNNQVKNGSQNGQNVTTSQQTKTCIQQFITHSA